MIYSGVLTVVLAVNVLSGFVSAPKTTRVEQLNVQRINPVEPDGTLHMVISDKARFPGAIIKGRDFPHERLDAGMLFYNDEGTENGGLIFSGHKEKNGKLIDAGGSLTVDKYEQDQRVQLVGADNSDGHNAGLIVSDRPGRSIEKDRVDRQKIDALPAPAREKLKQARLKSYYVSTRIVLARGDDGVAKINLRDADGHRVS